MGVRSVAYEGRRGEYAEPPLFGTKMYKILYFMRKITKINNIFIQFSFQSGSNPGRNKFLGVFRGHFAEKNSQKFRACGALFPPWDEFQIYLVFCPLPFGNF